MTYLQAIVLGVIQGLTEFLPVSSSGHLVILPQVFGWADQGLGFDVVVHLGTLVAVVVYFRKMLWSIIRALATRDSAAARERRLGGLLVLSIIPAGVAGLLGDAWIEEHVRSVTVIAWNLIGWGVVLYLADRYYRASIANGKQLTETRDLGVKQALSVAFAQALALIPGTSRSGITMTAGLFSGLTKTAAAEFSFLMSVPIIGLAGAKKILDLVSLGLGDLSLGVLAAGFVAAAVSGFVAISGLMVIIRRWSFTPFVVYRVLLGIALLIFFT